MTTVSPLDCPHCGGALRSCREGEEYLWACIECKMKFEIPDGATTLSAKGGSSAPTNLETLLANKDLERHRATLQKIFGDPALYGLNENETDAVWFALGFITCALSEREQNRLKIAELRHKLQTTHDFLAVAMEACKS